MPRPRTAARSSTSTSSFGVSRRENHDATAFYDRFPAPTPDPGEQVNEPKALDEVYVGDSRDMADVADASVALVVTSPPYFAGKAYEEELGRDHIPASYVEYLEMLSSVFAESVRVLEPGGRIAVNVANLGRKPYRSLSADVIAILQDRLGLWLRGEIIWQKARGASGNCAWGSYRKPGNPVMRDVTERVIVASKGRLDRALSARTRARDGLPHQATISADEFTEATLDVWELPAESATKVGHPAPFPVELPQRLIELHTYQGDLVLDPFMGAGSTAVAAVRTGRHFVGYDTDPAYVELTRRRVAAARAAGPADQLPHGGDGAVKVAEELMTGAGFRDVRRNVATPGGVVVPFVATDRRGRRLLVDVGGAFTSTTSGLGRADALWRAIGRAAVLQAEPDGAAVVLLAAGLPPVRSAARVALERSMGHAIDVLIDLAHPDAGAQLAALAAGSPSRTRRRSG